MQSNNFERSSISFSLNESEFLPPPTPQPSLNEEFEITSMHSESEIHSKKDKEKREEIIKDFLRKRLRKQDLKETYEEIRKITQKTLLYALQTLQMDKCERNTNYNYNNTR